MQIPDSAIGLAQKFLIKSGAGPITSPGSLDPQTVGLLDAVLGQRKAELSAAHRTKIVGGDGARKVTAYVQLIARDHGIDPGVIDGLWGPSTQHAYEDLVYFDTNGTLPPAWRDEAPSGANPNAWPMEKEAKLMDFYGPVGKNQAKITLPYTHYIAWDLRSKVTSMTCHKKVAASVQRVLKKTLDHYGKDGIHDLRLDIWGGCLNVRRKRGGSGWSTHAWGIAIDYDPDNNQLKWGRDRATLSRPAYQAWWSFWEAEGWCSLGRARNFDWMHVQAARV
jgi:hypothetical protein